MLWTTVIQPDGDKYIKYCAEILIPEEGAKNPNRMKVEEGISCQLSRINNEFNTRMANLSEGS